MIKTEKGHFWLTFDNGYTISVFNGFGSYSENHFKNEVISKNDFEFISSCDCEIAITRDNKFVTNKILKNGDDVCGWVSVKELANIIKKVSELKND